MWPVTYFVFLDLSTVVTDGLKQFLDLVDEAWSRDVSDSETE